MLRQKNWKPQSLKQLANQSVPVKKITIIIPIYNEQRTLEQVLLAVEQAPIPSMQKQVVMVDDASIDASPDIAQKFAQRSSEFELIIHPENQGKSQAVKTGMLASVGDWVIVHDADTEYDPNQIQDLVIHAEDNSLDVVYGNRFNSENKTVIYWKNYIGNRFLSLISNLFTYPRIKTWIPDMEVCYKLAKGDVIRQIAPKIKSRSNFGIEPELTARLARFKNTDGSRLKFGVISISYAPRSVTEGKHMKAFKDGAKALLEIIRFNLS